MHLHTTLHVCNDQGVVAFATGAHLDQLLHVQPPNGLFRSICHIPSNLLNSGLHIVNLLLVRGSRDHSFRLDDAISFEVIDAYERDFAWFGREPGVVMPHLDWSTELLMRMDD